MADEAVDIAERLKQRIGRPSRVESVAIRFTEDELARLERASARNATSLREWARETLLRESERSKEDALFTEIVATRLLLVSLFRNLSAGQKVTTESINDAMAQVRRDKFAAAKDVLAQYTSATQEGR